MSRQDRALPAGGAPPVEVTVSGALDATTVPHVGTVLDRALAGRPRELVIDLAGCPFLDATAIAMILDAHRRAWRKDTLLTLRNPAPRVRRILEIARLDHVLHITPPPPLPPDHDAPPGHDAPPEPGRLPAGVPDRGALP